MSSDPTSALIKPLGPPHEAHAGSTVVDDASSPASDGTVAASLPDSDAAVTSTADAPLISLAEATVVSPSEATDADESTPLDAPILSLEAPSTPLEETATPLPPATADEPAAPPDPVLAAEDDKAEDDTAGFSLPAYASTSDFFKRRIAAVTAASALAGLT